LVVETEEVSVGHRIVLMTAIVLSLPACGAPSDGDASSSAASALGRSVAGSPPARSPRDEAAASPVRAWPAMVVHKSPSCGCCSTWVDHVRKAGFQVEVRDAENFEPVKQRLGIPYGKGSCHTAEVGGYFVEGHVPAADIQRLLTERPAAKGLVLPGMPMGSPGMEMPDGRTQAYTVELVTSEGQTQPFARHAGSASH
jgi:hypothetical protein